MAKRAGSGGYNPPTSQKKVLKQPKSPSIKSSKKSRLTLEALLTPRDHPQQIPEFEGHIEPASRLPTYSFNFLNKYRGKMHKLKSQGRRGVAFRFSAEGKDMLGKYVHDIISASSLVEQLGIFRKIDSEHPDSGLAFPLAAFIEQRYSEELGNEERLFTITPFIHGPTLNAYRIDNGGTIQGEQWKNIMTQLARSVNIMHSHEIAHRDLHPSNVLMHNDKTVIVDPDEISLNPHATNGSRAFTDGYLVLDYLGADDAKRQDICQLGMVGFELFTGINPLQYARDEIGEHASFLKKNQALAAIDAKVKDVEVAHILKKCVDFDAGYQDIQELRSALGDARVTALVPSNTELDIPSWLPDFVEYYDQRQRNSLAGTIIAATSGLAVKAIVGGIFGSVTLGIGGLAAAMVIGLMASRYQRKQEWQYQIDSYKHSIQLQESEKGLAIPQDSLVTRVSRHLYNSWQQKSRPEKKAIYRRWNNGVTFSVPNLQGLINVLEGSEMEFTQANFYTIVNIEEPDSDFFWFKKPVKNIYDWEGLQNSLKENKHVIIKPYSGKSFVEYDTTRIALNTTNSKDAFWVTVPALPSYKNSVIERTYQRLDWDTGKLKQAQRKLTSS